MKRILWYLLTKIGVGLLCSLIQGLFFLIFALIRSCFVPYDPQFGPIWLIPLISQFYSIPAYALVGSLCSILIDVLTHKLQSGSRYPRYAIRFILYVLSGITVIVLFQHLNSTSSVVYVKPEPFADVLRVIFAGGVPGLLYYHISLLIHWLKARKSAT